MIFGKNKRIHFLESELEKYLGYDEVIKKIKSELKNSKKSIEEKDNEIENLKNQIKVLKDELVLTKSQLFESESQKNILFENHKKLRAKCGGLQAGNNNYKCKLIELRRRMKTLQKNYSCSVPLGYKIKKLPPAVPKKKPTIRVKKSSIGGAANAILRQKNEREDENV